MITRNSMFFPDVYERFPWLEGCERVVCPACGKETLSDDGHMSNPIVRLADGRIGIARADFSDGVPFMAGNWMGHPVYCWYAGGCGASFAITEDFKTLLRVPE